MAYAEKRGRSAKPWRVKYKLPSGIETSESGFETKAAALTWGRDQEARIREGRWTDPNAGKITVSAWIDRWMTLQDVGLSTVENREYLIRRFIRPSFGTSELGLAHHRGHHPVGELHPRPDRRLPPRGPGRAGRAVHDARRRRRGEAAADPVQPRDKAPQPRPADRPQARPRAAAGLGHAAAGLTGRRAGRAAVRPGRGLHHGDHDRLHRPALGRDDRPRTRSRPRR